MKTIYHIKRKTHCLDDYFGIVVVAPTEERARNLAYEYIKSCGEEQSALEFLDPEKSTLTQIEPYGWDRVILTQFHNG